jgi:asparagine synthase (glutamine-hydrolysing)
LNVNGLPSTFKLRGFETKAILKRVARKYLPRDVVDRRKSGFGVPLREWFADVRGLGRFLDDARESPDLAPFTRKEVVARLVEQHRSGEADHSEALWTIVNFMLWLRGLEGQRP